MSSPVLERFLRYVGYDTQSREGADTYPSTPGQLVLLRDLVTELRALGLADAAIDEHGYVVEAERAGDRLHRARGHLT
jgi:tripeptide aminopeptidase